RPGQFVGVTLFDFFETKDPEFLPLAAHRKALLGQSVSFEVEWAGRTYASHCEPLRNPDNSIRGVIGIALDITRQKRIERGLQKSASLLRATLDSTDVAILVVDERGKISNFNESFVQLWRVPEDIAKARDEDRMLAFLLESVADPGDFAKHVMGLHSKRDVETKGPLRLKDGRVLQRTSKPQRVDGKTVGTVLSFREGAAWAEASPASFFSWLPPPASRKRRRPSRSSGRGRSSTGNRPLPGATRSSSFAATGSRACRRPEPRFPPEPPSSTFRRRRS